MLSMTAFCWGCNAIFGKLAVGEVSPLLIVSLRWFGVILLLSYIGPKAIAKEWKQLRQHLPLLFIMGALGFASFNGLFYIAAHSTTALNIGIIQGAIPVFVLIGVFFIYGTQISQVQSIGVALTMLGVCLVASAGSLEKLATLTINKGDYFMLSACVLYAGYAVCLRRVSHISTMAVFSMVTLAAFVASLPMSAYEFYSGSLQWPTTKGWVVVAMITILPSFIAQICFIKGVGIIGAGRAGIFANLVPVFAAILSILVLSEHFQLYHGIALALVVGGIWMSERKKKTPL